MEGSAGGLTVSARDAYLAYQAGIGTDEVILPHPLISIRKKTGAVSGTGDFFQEVFKSLSGPLERSRTARANEPVTSPVSAPIPPDFASLDEFWKYLGREYPKWFPSAGGNLARAEGPTHPVLALVESAPFSADAPRVFDGEPRLLLDKMMRAIGLDRSRLYLTSIQKTPAPSPRGWARKDLARMLPFLFHELRLTGAGHVLLLGESTAQAVLKTGNLLLDLRQKPAEAEGMVFAATHHPADLLRDEALKRETWTDLKWLKTRLEAWGVK